MRKFLMITAILCVLCVPSCMQPPPQTIEIHLDGKPALAQDADSDGVVDVDETGKPIVVPGSEAAYGAADTVDSVLPTILQAVAGIVGIPLLLGIGAAWRKHKFGRIIANTVMSVQAARQRLKKDKFDTALDLVDETLGANQTRETTAVIRDIKESIGAPSVR